MLDPLLFKDVERLHQARTPFCLVTVVDGRGSIPQIVGAKAIFTAEGLAYGTIGGGAVEAICRERAQALLAAQPAVRTHFERCNLARDAKMTCSGEMALYFELYRPELDWNIVVFGAGHVAQKLCRFLIELDARVICIDTRPEWIARLPASDRLDARQVADYTEGVTWIGDHTMVLLMTMGHASDAAILKNIARARPHLTYLGVIGSDAKAKILRRQLRDDGLDPDFIDSIVCPIGEEIGNNTPPEIAISIVAQLLKVRDAVPLAVPSTGTP